MDSLFRTINVASSGMTAERFRLDVISQNLSNADTTKTENGGPYVRKGVTFQEVLNSTLKGTSQFSGVKVNEIFEDAAPFRLEYDPSHPEANEEGYVEYPNVNVLNEMIDMITAQRAYDLNASVISTAKNMYNSALNIGK
jgi:flagellar basal-body rod protein FlgC